MAEPDAGRSATHSTPSDASRGPTQRPAPFSPLARDSARADLATAALAAGAAAALVASYFATVVYVTTKTASCVDLATPAHSAQCVKTGGDQHSVAYIVLGLAVLALGLLFVGWRLALAAWGIAVLGAVAILIALVADVPQTGRSGVLATDFSSGTAHAGAGLWLELVGGALAVAAGVLAMLGARGRR